MVMESVPANVREAVLDHVPRLLTPAGQRVAQRGTYAGDQYVASRSFKTDIQRVPGIGTGSAYVAGDAFGTKFYFTVPTDGTISQVVFLDYDDEGLVKDLVLFGLDFTATADNGAFAPSDTDLHNCLGVVRVDVFYNFGSNQLGLATPALAYSLPSGQMWCQIVTQGADNITAGAIPEVFLVIV